MKIAFICIHNSCRSQMAEALANNFFKKENLEFYSAGTEKYHEVKPMAKQVVEELGIEMDNYYPKLIKDIPKDLDIVITMGCGVSCPNLKVNLFKADWGLTDPSGKSIEDFREIRDLILAKLKDLVENI